MALLSLGAFTTYYVAQMRLRILQDAYLTLSVLQLVTLIIYLWGPEKLKFRPFKAIYHLFFASSLFVIPAFVFIFFSFCLLLNDYCCLSAFLFAVSPEAISIAVIV